MESLRLNRTLNCPRCSFTVKPFIMAKRHHDVLDVDYLEVKCPLEICGHTFNIFPKDDDPLPGDPPVDA